MQPTANAETDRAAEIVPEISHTVPWRVTSVTALPDARLEVTFVDARHVQKLKKFFRPVSFPHAGHSASDGLIKRTLSSLPLGI
jgi:hypothetical protein